MVPKEEYESAKDFIAKMDAGDLDGQFASEIQNLTPEQLEEVAQTLMERDEKRRK